MEWLEYRLHPWSTFVVLPAFALADAGVHLDGGMLRDAAGSRVTIGVVLGLVVGRSIGILGAAWSATRTGLAVLPDGTTHGHVVGVAVLAGMGFSVSMFVTELAFTDPGLADQARVGVFAASLVAGRPARPSSDGWRGARPPSGDAHQPTAPSTSSRIRSAWPLWRASSSITGTETQRNETGSPAPPPQATSSSGPEPPTGRAPGPVRSPLVAGSSSPVAGKSLDGIPREVVA